MIDLFPHNLTAYRAAISMLEKTGKAAVIHPTGTGKSFIAFKLIEDNPDRRFLWLSPSEYIYQTQVEAVHREAPEFSTEKVLFYTYAKLAYLTESQLAALSQIPPDYVIVDEYHRGGAPEWEKSLRKVLELCGGAKLLGLSATNIRYLDNRRDMAQELFDGYIASEMSLGDAIVKGILPAPKYVMALYQYDKELAKYQKRVNSLGSGLKENAQRILDDLRRALENAEGLDTIFSKHISKKSSRLIAFCAGQEHMQLMRLESEKWFRKIDPEMHVYTVYSDNPTASADFRQFKQDSSDHLKILFCIDMLNEGIHVENLDGVIMFRPTISPIVYKQQLGRALSAGSGKTPLVFDIVNNYDGLCSVGAIGEEMTRAMRFFPNGEGSSVWKETGFTLLDEVRDARILFHQLDSALSSGWEVYFRGAKAYFEEHGHLEIPRRYVTEDGLGLGMWIQNQRRVRSGTIAGTLTEAQIQRLNAIGMVWENRLEKSWNRKYQAAERYYEEFGNLLVPARYTDKDGFALGVWICNQRQAKSAGTLSPERIERLEKIGMAWSCADEKWETYYLEALRYYNREGNLLVPRTYVTENSIRLGQWLRTVTRAYEEKKSTITPEQIQALEAIGMVWGNRNKGRWQKTYEQAKLYYEKHGDLDIPQSYVAPDGTKLGIWVSVQRAKRTSKTGRSGSITPDRIALLDNIGMDWRLNTKKEADGYDNQ